MTCKEKFYLEHPNIYTDFIKTDCPHGYSYLDVPVYCTGDYDEDLCNKCWNREIPEEDDDININNIPYIKDSGARREFETGAVRDIQEGKGRCDLLPLDVVSYFRGKILETISDYQITGDYNFLYKALQQFMDKNRKDVSTTFLEISKHFEEGCKKYGENNWQKGIPTHCYIDSAVRHYLKYLRGDKDEPHDRAFCWNILCCIWTCIHKPELNDYRKKENNNDT